MKVRTCLLFACMIVVPGLAMFSHRVPAELRSATRCALWDPLLSWASSWTAPRAGEEVRGVELVIQPGALPQGSADAEPVSLAGGHGLGVEPSGDPFGPAEPAVVDGRLAGLGGVALECRPVDGLEGTHVASCRVAMDSAGQLHRVFQAAGPTPGEAVSALADEVERWRARLAGGDSPPTGFGGAVY